MKIHKGDTVLVIAGKDRGKAGKIVRAFPDKGTVVVDGANIRKRHVRPRKSGQKGEMVQFSAPLNASNVMLVCGKCGKTTRFAFRVDGNKKSRVCKKCGSDI